MELEKFFAYIPVGYIVKSHGYESDYQRIKKSDSAGFYQNAG